MQERDDNDSRVRMDEHSLDLLELAIHGTPGKKSKPTGDTILRTPPSGRSSDIVPITQEKFLSPELAFKSNYSKKSKKRVTFDNFKSRISKVAVFDGDTENLDLGEISPAQSPVGNRKIKKSPASPEKIQPSQSKSKAKTSFRSIINQCVSSYSCMTKGLWIIFVKQCRTILPFIYTGLITAFVSDVLPGGPKYNVLILVATHAATSYDKFPEKSIRPFLVIFVLVLASVIIDFQILLFGESSSPIAIVQKALVGYTLLAKVLVIYRFLNEGKQVVRARKYIMRRFRVFCYPTGLPKRVMREVLTRILAIEWLQLFSTALYGILFAISATTLEYYFANVNPSSPIKLSITMFLFGRLISSFVLFGGLFADTDTVLCLGYFGCLGFCMNRLKEYTRRKRDEYNGWPLPFLYNKYRFYVWSVFKFLDFIWGILGWIIVGSSTSKIFGDSNHPVKAMMVVIMLTMLTTDVWIPFLVYWTYWLIGEYDKIIDEGLDAGDSDDSELDDFGVRTPLTTPIKRAQNKKSSKSPAFSSNSDDADNSDKDNDENDDDENYQSSPAKSSVMSSVHSPMAHRSPPASANFDDIHIDIARDSYATGDTYVDDVSSEQFQIVIDPYSTVTAEDFADMWGVLSTLGEFSCKVKPNVLYMRESSLSKVRFGFEHVVEHLQNMGFFIVAAGENIWDTETNSSISKLFAYTVGYSSTAVELVTPIYFLLELKLVMSLGKCGNDEEDTYFEVFCTGKCTKREYLAAFVEELNLGCVFDLS